MIKKIPKEQGTFIETFLKTYLKKTGKKIISVPSFIVNLHKAALLGKFHILEILVPERGEKQYKTENRENIKSQQSNYSNGAPYILSASPTLEFYENLNNSTEIRPFSLSSYEESNKSKESERKKPKFIIYKKEQSEINFNKTKPTLSVFKPELQKRINSPKNSCSYISLSPRNLASPNPSKIIPKNTELMKDNFLNSQKNSSKILTARSSKTLSSKKSIDEKSQNSYTFKPMINNDKYKNVKSRINSPISAKNQEKYHKIQPNLSPKNSEIKYFSLFLLIFNSFSEIYDKVKKYQENKMQEINNILKSAKIEKQHEIPMKIPKNAKILKIKIDASFIEKDNKNTAISHKINKIEQKIARKKCEELGYRRSSLC